MPLKSIKMTSLKICRKKSLLSQCLLRQIISFLVKRQCDLWPLNKHTHRLKTGETFMVSIISPSTYHQGTVWCFIILKFLLIYEIGSTIMIWLVCTHSFCFRLLLQNHQTAYKLIPMLIVYVTYTCSRSRQFVNGMEWLFTEIL